MFGSTWEDLLYLWIPFFIQYIPFDVVEFSESIHTDVPPMSHRCLTFLRSLSEVPPKLLRTITAEVWVRNGAGRGDCRRLEGKQGVFCGIRLVGQPVLWQKRQSFMVDISIKSASGRVLYAFSVRNSILQSVSEVILAKFQQ